MKGEVIDLPIKIGFTVLFYMWNLFQGFKLDTQYPKSLVILYFYPLWRYLLLFTFVIGGLWCESLAMMMAFAIFFYFMDLQLLLYKEIE